MIHNKQQQLSPAAILSYFEEQSPAATLSSFPSYLQQPSPAIFTTTCLQQPSKQNRQQPSSASFYTHPSSQQRSSPIISLLLGGWLSNNSWACKQTFISHHITKDDQKLLTKTSQCRKNTFFKSRVTALSETNAKVCSTKKNKLLEGGQPTSITIPAV